MIEKYGRPWMITSFLACTIQESLFAFQCGKGITRRSRLSSGSAPLLAVRQKTEARRNLVALPGGVSAPLRVDRGTSMNAERLSFVRGQ